MNYRIFRQQRKDVLHRTKYIYKLLNEQYKQNRKSLIIDNLMIFCFVYIENL